MKLLILFFILIFNFSCHPLAKNLLIYDGKMPPADISEEMIWSSPGMHWNGIQYLGFNLKHKDKLSFRSAVYFTLDNLEDYDISDWVSSNHNFFGKIRVVRSFPTSDGYCRVYQSLIVKKDKLAKTMTNKACRSYTNPWVFYW